MENNSFNNLVYLRRLNSNELGYRAGKPGKAGRFFFISKAATSFFPPLSDCIVNDNVLLDVIPPFSNDIVLTKFEYHNSLSATEEEEENRNEYRLYLNVDNDIDRNYFKPDDIVLILKIKSPENNLTYKLLKFSPSDLEYKKLSKIIETSFPTKYRAHALVELKKLTFLPQIKKIKFGKKIIPKEIVELSFKEPVRDIKIAKYEDSDYSTRTIRSRSFRDLILYFYEDNCAITGKDLVIEYKDFKNLEAAHIFARAAGGGSHPSNGMALERNLHWAFDKGFFTLTEDYKIEVHPKAMHVPYLADKNGKKILVPQDTRSRPNLSAIKWHRENVFGLFLRTDV